MFVFCIFEKQTNIVTYCSFLHLINIYIYVFKGVGSCRSSNLRCRSEISLLTKSGVWGSLASIF